MVDQIINIQNLLAGKSPHEQHALIANTLEGYIYEILETAENAKRPHTTNFQDLGMDSLTAAMLKTKIEESLGGEIEIASSDIFNYPTIELLTGYVEDKLRLSLTK